jgi:hypothetical protein
MCATSFLPSDAAGAWNAGGEGLSDDRQTLQWSVFDEVAQDVAEQLMTTDRYYAGCHKCFSAIVRNKKGEFKSARSERMWCPGEEFCYEITDEATACPSGKPAVKQKEDCGPAKPSDYLTLPPESIWVQDQLEVEVACTHCVARNDDGQDSGLKLQYVWVPKLQTCLNGYILPGGDQLKAVGDGGGPTGEASQTESRQFCLKTCPEKDGKGCKLKPITEGENIVWSARCKGLSDKEQFRCVNKDECDWEPPKAGSEGEPGLGL